MKRLFALKGMLGRRDFIIAFLINIFTYLIINFIFENSQQFLYQINSIWILLFVYKIILLLFLVCTFYLFIFIIKRLRDLNRTSWLSILILIPIINIFFLAFLCLAEGRLRA
jgi:uncharacterized membrane protein YhaH (DUF805 family)